jgi:hypothetical protein
MGSRNESTTKIMSPSLLDSIVEISMSFCQIKDSFYGGLAPLLVWTKSMVLNKS